MNVTDWKIDRNMKEWALTEFALYRRVTRTICGYEYHTWEFIKGSDSKEKLRSLKQELVELPEYL